MRYPNRRVAPGAVRIISAHYAVNMISQTLHLVQCGYFQLPSQIQYYREISKTILFYEFCRRLQIDDVIFFASNSIFIWQ